MPNPTKGALLALKKSLDLANSGYDLMNQKRNILIHEMMGFLTDIKELRLQLEDSYKKAYLALQDANVTLGVVTQIALSIPIDNGLDITYRSVMGVEIPKVIYHESPVKLTYGIGSTNTKFDFAYSCFLRVRALTIKLAEMDNTAYRLASAIRKSQKRANALKHVVIPNLKKDIRFITEVLEEKEREEFARKKVIKNVQKLV